MNFLKKGFWLLFFGLFVVLNAENLAGNSAQILNSKVENSSEIYNLNAENLAGNSINSIENLQKNSSGLPRVLLSQNTRNDGVGQIQTNYTNSPEIPTNSPQNDTANATNADPADDFDAEPKAEPENDTANTADPEPNAELENDTANADFADDFADDFEAEFDEFKVSDPLSGYNKAMTAFNVGFYTYFLRPVAKGYDFVMPDFAQTGIKNFFTYISMPIRLISNALQFKFSEAGTELKRFGINTVFGFFGLIDAASKVGVPIHHSDFGLVLAHWGVGSGFHFVLPILGPSNLRDTLAIPVNWYMSPTTYIDTQSHTFISWLSVGLTSFNILNEVSINTPTMDEIYYNTPSLYPFLRDAYEKRRADMSK